MNDFKKGFIHGLPIGLGYLSVSFSFGILCSDRGLTLWQAVLISMTNLTSAVQYAGLDIMTGAGTLLEMCLSQLVINLRYALMSIALSQNVTERMTPFKRLFFGAFHTDEIFAVAAGSPKKVGPKYFLGLIILPYIGWALGTFLGALCGQILPEIIGNALGVALFGMFIAIFIPEMKHSYKTTIVVLIAILLACAFRWVPIMKEVSSGFAIIICAVVASLIGAIFFPIKESTKEETANG